MFGCYDIPTVVRRAFQRERSAETLRWEAVLADFVRRVMSGELVWK